MSHALRGFFYTKVARPPEDFRADIFGRKS